MLITLGCIFIIIGAVTNLSTLVAVGVILLLVGLILNALPFFGGTRRKTY